MIDSEKMLYLLNPVFETMESLLFYETLSMDCDYRGVFAATFLGNRDFVLKRQMCILDKFSRLFIQQIPFIKRKKNCISLGGAKRALLIRSFDSIFNILLIKNFRLDFKEIININV